MSTVKAVPAPFLAARLKRKNFSYTGDVHIQGDARLEGQLVVGGDLLVDGNLQAEEVFCLGKLTVTGDIVVQSLYVGHALDGGGDIEVAHMLKTGCRAEWMARLLEFDQRKITDGSSYIDKLVDPALLKLRGEMHDFGEFGSIQALGFVSCDALDAHGSVMLDGVLEAGEVQFAGGTLAVHALQVDGDCNCRGEVFSATDIAVGGALIGATVACPGNLAAGSVEAESDLDIGGTLTARANVLCRHGEIRAGRWIAAGGSVQAGQYIKAGEAVIGEAGVAGGSAYGVLAGLALARTHWAELGFVSAPKRPRALLSGEFVAGKKCKAIAALEKKRERLLKNSA